MPRDKSKICFGSKSLVSTLNFKVWNPTVSYSFERTINGSAPKLKSSIANMMIMI